jgi:hypothetical protein
MEDKLAETGATLRWLAFAKRLQKQRLNSVDSFKDYLGVIDQQRQFMEGFIQSHPQFFHDGFTKVDALENVDLDALIAEQASTLFSYLLLRCASGALTSSKFSLDKILIEAMQYYKNQMIDITLHQFNVIRLIELKEHSRHSLRTLQTMNRLISETKPNHFSIKAIEELSTILKTEVSDQTPQALFERTLDLFISDADNEHESVLRHTLGFQTQTSIFSGNSEKSQMESFFNSEQQQHTPLRSLLSEMIQLLEQHQILIWNKVAKAPDNRCLTFGGQNIKDKTLKTLGLAIQEYADKLDNIKTDEITHYPNRNLKHLENRQQAVRTLLRAVNHAKEMTPPLQHLAIQLVHEINANKPTWSEHSLLTKIVDILLLGLPALYRYGTFKSNPEENKLFKTTKDIPQEMKKLRAATKDVDNEGCDDDEEGESPHSHS